MPKTRQQKEQTLRQANQDAQEAKSIVFVGCHGLPVPRVVDLRRQLRQESIKFQVIKKTLIKKVLDDTNLDVDVKNLGEGLAVAYCLNDETSAAKILVKFKKDNEALKIYGGILARKFINEHQVMDLSKLPGKLELYAKLAGSLNAPVFGFANALAGTMRGLLMVLIGIKEAKVNLN